MKTININIRVVIIVFLLLISGIFFFSSCKKDKELEADVAPVLLGLDISGITTRGAVLEARYKISSYNKITETGFYFSLNSNIGTIAYISQDVKQGLIRVSLSDLLPDTKYYYAAYIKCNDYELRSEVGSFNTIVADYAQVQTMDVSLITTNTVICGGDVTDDGGVDVSDRGLCWSETHNPTISNPNKSCGQGTGSFSCEISELKDGITYYIRAYATNSKGTAYGQEKSFTTKKKKVPTVSTNSVSDITYTSASCGGNVSDDGEMNVTERGLCWSISQSPTISDSKKTSGKG